MELEITIDGKSHLCHIPKSCNINLVIRDGKIIEGFDSKKLKFTVE